jgi:phenylpropionate dioxygenase-like ring-hydroxylating dioxygenase large terminal subunit
LAFLKNCWYVSAWDHELLGDTLLSRTVCGQSLLLYRKNDGTPVALDNKCCHRHAPLHLGRKEGDCVRCMYHGLKYDETGRCVEIPGQDDIPVKLAQRSFPVVQRKRWIWVWMGKPERADESLIPDAFSLADPAWRWKPSYLHYNANYLNIADNLLDFSHLSYVHEKTFGGSPNIAQARPEVTRIDRGIRVSRPVRDTVPAPYHQRLGKFAGKVNRWFAYDLVAPGVLMLEASVRPVEDADDDFRRALRFHSCQALTPETEGTTHYFFMQAHGFALDDAVVTESIHESQHAAFLEDKRILEAQQQMIDASPATPMFNIVADKALVQYRRLIDELIVAESAPPATPESFRRQA